jgi:inner membrane protein
MPLDAHILWFIAGFILIVAEFFLPGIILIFIGLGAWLAALTTWLGWTPTLGGQFLVFGGGSAVLLIGLRRVFKSWLMGFSKTGDARAAEEEFLGKPAKVISPLGPGREGKIEFKGASWNARAEQDLPAGAPVTITAREGLWLTVVPRG